jgi:hypothetical protein
VGNALLHDHRKEKSMSDLSSPGPKSDKQRGGIGYVLLWLLGVPIPVLIIFALLRGCA